MIKYIVFIIMSLSLTSCTPTTTVNVIGRKGITVSENLHKSVVIAEIKNIGTIKGGDITAASLATIGDEFAKKGFSVLERSDFGVVVDEHVFSEQIGEQELVKKFKSADYVVVATITKLNMYNEGQFYLLYSNYNKIVNVRVILKMINTRTGEAKTASGEAEARTHLVNIFVFGGYSDNKIGLFEDTFQVACSEAVKKLMYN